MSRLPRFPGAGLVHHLVQHGHNGKLIVLDEDDRRTWRALLGEALATIRVGLHGWALLPDHFHLVLTPRADGDIGRLMQSLGRRYVAGFNRRHDRSGTLWDGRYRASVLEPGVQVLVNLRFVDAQPHRQGASPEEALAWSSLAHHLGRGRDPWLTDPAEWWALGNTPFERQAAYAGLMEAGLPAEEVARITAAVRRGWPLGSLGFIAGLASRAGRSASPRPRGRPPRPSPG